MAKSKTKASPTFDYAVLTDAQAAVARDAKIGIARRLDASRSARRDWMRDGLAILHVRQTIGRGYFEGWVRAELPFTVRTAQNLSDAAEMLATVTGGEIISSWPEVLPTVAYRLAGLAEGNAVRLEFLARIIAGERVTLRQIEAALKPTEPAADLDTDADDPASLLPSRSENAARNHWCELSKGDRNRLLRLARTLPPGVTLDALVQVGEWQEAAPDIVADPDQGADSEEGDRQIEYEADEASNVIPLRRTTELSEEEAGRIRMHAMRNTLRVPNVEIVAPGVVVIHDEQLNENMIEELIDTLH